MDNAFNAKMRLFIAFCCFCYSAVLFLSGTRRSAGRYLGLAEFFMGLWNLLDALQEILKNILFSDPNYIITLQSLIYVVAEFACVSAFLFVMRLFALEDCGPRRRTYAVLLFPMAMVMLSAVGALFFHGSPFLRAGGYSGANSVFLWGYYYPKRPLYYVHCAYCYSILASALFMALRRCISDFRGGRRVLTLVSVCLVVFMLPSVYKVFFANSSISQRVALPVLFDALCILFTSTIAFFALYFDYDERSVAHCKCQMYNSLCLPIFVFNKDEKIIQANEFAWKFLHHYGIPLRKFDSAAQVFHHKSLQILLIPDSAPQGREFYISGVKDKALYQAQKVEIASGALRTIGSYIILSRIDFYAGIVRQLEMAAVTCELTGLRKRNAFEHLVGGELQRRSEAVCIVFAAVRGLSKLNESIGLKKTDLYIIKFASILRASLDSVLSGSEEGRAPPEIFRLTGALFGFMIPISMEDEIPPLFKEIRTRCVRFSSNKPAALACSLGYSVAQGVRTSVDSALQKSYQNMSLDESARFEPAPFR